MSFKVTTEEIAESDRVSTDRADYTVEPVPITISNEAFELSVNVTEDHLAQTVVGTYEGEIETDDEWASDWTFVGSYNKIVGLVSANENLTIYIEQSMDDSEEVDLQEDKTYLSDNKGGFSVELAGSYCRVRVANTSGATATVRAYARFSPGA